MSKIRDEELANISGAGDITDVVQDPSLGDGIGGDSSDDKPPTGGGSGPGPSADAPGGGTGPMSRD